MQFPPHALTENPAVWPGLTLDPETRRTTVKTTKSLRDMTQQEMFRQTTARLRTAVRALVPAAEIKWNPHFGGNRSIQGYYVAGCGPRAGGGISKSEDAAWRRAAADIWSALHSKFPHFIPEVD